MNRYGYPYDPHYQDHMRARMREAEEAARREYDDMVREGYQPNTPPPTTAPNPKPVPNVLDMFPQYEKRPYIFVDSEEEVDKIAIPIELVGIEFVVPLKDGSAIYGLMRDPVSYNTIKVAFDKREVASESFDTPDDISGLTAEIQSLKSEINDLKAFKEMAMAFVSGEKESEPKTQKRRAESKDKTEG